MLEPTSRYYNIETATMKMMDSDGGSREIRYVRRRFIPSTDDITTLVEHMFRQGDRLDNITARYLGDPAQFWRVCDVNNVLSPADLEEIGRTIRIALPNL
jgi:hypothetical protein